MGRKTLKRMNQSHAGLTEWGFSQLSLRETDVVLDIGCGGGMALKRLSAMLEKGRLYGVDYSETAVKCALGENKTDVKSGKMEIVQASVSNLPFENNFFDVVTSVESYYFWPDLERDLQEVRRVLRPGGVFALIAEMYRHENQSEKDKEIVQALRMHNNTPQEFTEMMRGAGFSEVGIEQDKQKGWICVLSHK